MSELITYVVLILTLWGGVIPSNVDVMEGGTVITDSPGLYSFTAKLVDTNSSSTACLGVMVSSLVTYTSAYCHVQPKFYKVLSSLGQSGTAVLEVKNGVSMNDFTMIVSNMPGVVMEVNSLVPGPHIAKFSTDVIEAEMMLAVFAYEKDQFKACVVKSVTMWDDRSCDDLYMEAQKMNPDAMMPKDRTPGLVCAIEGKKDETLELEMFNATQTVSGGMPCKSSIGAPAVANQLVIGIVVYASCKNQSRVVLIQPSVRGIRRDVISSRSPTTAYTWQPYTGTHNTIKEIKQRRMATTTTPTSRAVDLGPKHIMVWTAVAVSTIVCAI